ncbi:21 kDa protein-like [Cornus florida]|uniref:21 kDa protein-like n=1 Tax=Cornus florida TaxID=4283 RepID=UPI00289D03F8|nr:21 kDa protein-like [Cornus florida]
MGASNLTNPCSYNIITFLITVLVFISHMKPTLASKAPKTCTNFIKTSCNSTTYPSLCYKSLSPYAPSVKTSPKGLCNAALSVTIRAARNTLSVVSKLTEQKGITHTEAATIKDCIENVGDSIDDLKQSLKAMGSLIGAKADKESLMADVKTWMSAAITDEDTCTDGFAGRNISPTVKNTIRNSKLGIAKLTSNALSLINHLNI